MKINFFSKQNLKFLSSEKFFLAAIIAAVLFLNLIPYVYQYGINPQGKTYIGSFPIVTDKPTYLAEMTQGEEGNWLAINKYTTEPQKGTLIYIFYIILGHIAKFLHISAETTFFLGRFVFGAILISAIIYSIRYFIRDELQRKMAYLLVFFSSGLGWLTLNPNSLDLWLLEAMPAFRFSTFPHMALANTLLLAAIFAIYRSFTAKSLRFAIISGVLAFILNFVLPFHAFLLYLIVLLLWIAAAMKKDLLFAENAKFIAIFFTISLPSFIYMARLGLTDPIWKEVEKQNILPSPGIFNIINGYGLLFILSMLGIYLMAKNRNPHFQLFFIWIFSAFSLSHFPIPMQLRALATGLYIPLAITASFGIIKIYEYLKEKRDRNLDFKIIFLFVAIALPGNALNIKQFTMFAQNNDDPVIYLPSENIEAMKWLKKNSSENSVILSSYFNGNLMPYYANRAVYIGHWAATVDIAQKRQKTKDFYLGIYFPEEVYSFLKKEKINYVFFSEEEKATDGFYPEKYSFLEKVYQNDTAAIYKFKN